MTDLAALCDDLAAEHAALDTLVSQLDEAAWGTPTPAIGWMVRDQLSHLAFYDGQARLAATEPDRFRSEAAQSTQGQLEQHHLALGRQLTGDALLAWWREERAAMLHAFRSLDQETRLPWFGPAMGAATFITARLMETWSHGHDITDALALDLPATARLRHVAHLGVRTRAFSYTLRGLTPPTTDVRLELTSPDGDHWTWGDPLASDTITGPVRDFCLVVTQRRHPADTDLIATGPLAHEWLTLAQAFAGHPGLGRPPGLFPRQSQP
jgi:uncharacterized protein (TIGR03084 family)